MKTNGITATLVMKGNERQTGRKLEPEARSASEYVHVKKHCFQKKKKQNKTLIPILWAWEHGIHICGFGFNSHSRDGR